MNWSHFLHQALTMPPHRVVSKVINRTQKNMNSLRQRRGDRMRSTYAPLHLSQGEFQRYLTPLPVAFLRRHAEMIGALTQHYLAHRFDLLGSGWLQVKHGVFCRGVEGYRYEAGRGIQVDRQGQWLEDRISHSNLEESQRIWRLIDSSYTPIDWHLDFKSGYRWSEDIWYLDIPHGHRPGVDIKVPWELARMQHLPLFAWAYALAKDGQEGFASESVYGREFRNQVLDFIATNPPRFGVNWRSTMDVAIRISNWLVTYDLLRACGVFFDDSFETTFFYSVCQHGRHILSNLEWDEIRRGNHYLSNVVGLLFVASYLPCSPETDTWLAFAIQEVVNEVGRQFYKDGSNFEASSSYHRLSAEMVAYATALILALPYEKRMALKKYDHHLLKSCPKLRPCSVPLYSLAGERFTPFPLWYIERLEKMAEFTMHLTKPNGHVPQIGDNDSGRFLKFQPLFHLIKVDGSGDQTTNLTGRTALSDTGHYWDEDALDHRHLLAAINGLFGREDFAEFIGSGWIETEIVSGLVKGFLLPSYKDRDAPTAAEREYIHEKEDRGRICRGDDSQPIGKVVSKKDEHLSRNKLYAYPEFGMFIFKSKNIFLAIRCGSLGQNGGHAHNDNLSFELNVRGRDFIIDGGSYLYTPFPNIRNVFRSTKAHNTLILNGLEQNDWADGLVGLFSMRDDAQARILKLGIQYLMGEHYGFGPVHRREFKMDGSSLVVEDILDTNQASEIILNLAPEVEILCLEKHGSEEFFLEMSSADFHVKALFKWFKGAEIINGYFSRGYGKRVKNLLVKCHRSKPHTRIEIALGEGDD